MTPEQEWEPELTDAQKIIRNLNKANIEMLRRLKREFGLEVDPTGQRNEMFMEKLIEWGVVTSEQMEEFNLAWVDFFNSYLMKLETDYRAAAKKAEQDAKAAHAARKLGVSQQSAGLVVPGHIGRQNGDGRRRR